MQIIQKRVDELKPYENNQKKHTRKQIENVAASIRRFGWQQPIVIDENGTVVIGHCRLLAAKKLKMAEVPVTVATGLSEEEIKELRIADNKTNESEWDMDALALSLDGLTFDGMDFDFNLPEDVARLPFEPEDEESYYGDERERTYNNLNLHDYDPFRVSGRWQMPTIRPCGYVPDALTAFHEFVGGAETDTVHFFLDDYQFERIWAQPHKYIDMMVSRGIKGALTPDFSLYTDMPEALRIYNVYRNRLVGQMMQDAGLQVIPTLQWAQESTFPYCFDGIGKGGTVAVSTVGVVGGGDCDIWREGMREAIKRVKPGCVLIYGAGIDFDFGGIAIKRYKARSFAGSGDNDSD